MIKITLLILMAILFSACVNQHGISAKYYSDCEEYYDFQGFYHKECGKDDIVTYSEIRDAAGNLVDSTKASATKAVNYLLGDEKKSNADTNQQNSNPGSVW